MVGLGAEKTRVCVACRGTGLNSKGRPCVPCQNYQMHKNLMFVQYYGSSGKAQVKVTLKPTCLGKELLDD